MRHNKKRSPPKNVNIMNEDMFAACNLVGLNINDWNVIKKLDAPDASRGETGGNFSICYIVQKDGIEYFMKVMDYRRCMLKPLIPGQTRISVVSRATQEFNYEIALSQHCHDRKVANVINYIDGGETEITSFVFPTVSYIIYEKADGNIRNLLDLSTRKMVSEKLKTLTFKLKSLHDVSLGVKQLHQNDVSHQDIKPSNILSIGDVSKLGDLGRSLCMDPDIQCPYPVDFFNGDWNYASPESYFGFRLKDVKERLYQMDNYMIGSLIVYYITGISFNALLEQHLPAKLRMLVGSGLNFEAAKSYLTNAYHEALLDFEKDIPLDDVKEGLVKIVSYLCQPDPERRGHPKNIGTKNRTPNYDLERTISELDLMYRKAEIGLIRK